MKLAAVINSFNRKDLMTKAVESLTSAMEREPMEYAVVVFDAGSKDGSLEWLESFGAAHPEVPLHVMVAKPGEDTSFSAGVNRGCAYALELYPELAYLFLYETDNWLASAHPVHTAIRVLEREATLGAMGFTVRLYSGKRGGWGMAYPTVSSFVVGRELSKRFNLPRAVISPRTEEGATWWPADIVYTSPLVIKTQAWLRSGGMDAEAFPFADCDLDWAWRVAQQGYQLGVLETDDVVHDGTSQSSSWSNMRVLSSHAARFRLLRRYRGGSVVAAIPALFLRHVAEFGLLLGLVLARKRTLFSLKKRSILLRGVWSGYRLT